MKTNAPATGFQIALLIFLVEFLIAIAAKYIARGIGWPPEFFGLLGNLLGFGVAATVLFGYGPLRRRFVGELSRPIPRSRMAEVLVVAIAKPAIPFGVMGALAIYYIFASPQPDLFGTLGLASDPEGETRRFYSVHGMVQATLIGLIVGPFIEELVYRGLLYRAWERQWGWFPAMIVTSAIFGLVHPSHMLSAFFGSVVYVCLLRRTGTLWAPICAHSIFNLLSAWPLLGHYLFVKDRDTVTRLESWTVELVCLGISAAVLSMCLWLARRPREDSEGPDPFATTVALR